LSIGGAVAVAAVAVAAGWCGQPQRGHALASIDICHWQARHGRKRGAGGGSLAEEAWSTASATAV
jgi:hypothetical protein